MTEKFITATKTYKTTQRAYDLIEKLRLKYPIATVIIRSENPTHILYIKDKRFGWRLWDKEMIILTGVNYLQEDWLITGKKMTLEEMEQSYKDKGDEFESYEINDGTEEEMPFKLNVEAKLTKWKKDRDRVMTRVPGTTTWYRKGTFLYNDYDDHNALYEKLLTTKEEVSNEG